MALYKEAADFTTDNFAVGTLKSVVSAVPFSFDLTLFLIWVFFTAGCFVMIQKTTGQRKYLFVLMAVNFLVFLSSIMLVLMNSAEFQFLSPYWVAFYLMMSVLSYWGSNKFI